MRKTYQILIAMAGILIGFIVSGIAFTTVQPPLGEIMLITGSLMTFGGAAMVILVLLKAIIEWIKK